MEQLTEQPKPVKSVQFKGPHNPANMIELAKFIKCDRLMIETNPCFADQPKKEYQLVITIDGKEMRADIYSWIDLNKDGSYSICKKERNPFE